ncbi:MAG: 50S ribosomal protein L30e [Sulfolobales archaeon]|nr:50S ribosomal protein L30e [Sulfolobales archaeon]MCX8199583.1 50S ribosomal protein L30e [Sulfolobales archaeon]MDW8170536.1 50S ribosomal protein L30e [Desulfurococcaceae archaeon]
MSQVSEVDVVRALQTAIKTGNIVIGSRRTIELVKHGRAKLVIVASNAPPEVRRDIEYYAKLSGVTVYIYPGTNMDLGAACGKPFSITSLTIIDPGQSNIVELVKALIEVGK